MVRKILFWKDKYSSFINIKGFTLIELLIVIAIFGIISVSIMSVFSKGLDIYNRVKDYGRQQIEAVLFFERIERDIRGMFYFSNIGFSGDDKNMSFPGLVRMGKTENVRVTVGRIFYYFDEKTGYLIKAEQTYPFAVSKVNTVTRKIKLLRAEQLAFKYLCYNKQINSEEKYEWKDEWDSKDGMPKAVMITIRFNSAGREYVWSKIVLIPVV